MIILIIILFAIIALIELPPLIKAKARRELTVFIILFIFTLTLAILQSMDVKIPNPVKGVKYLIKDVLHLSYQ